MTETGFPDLPGFIVEQLDTIPPNVEREVREAVQDVNVTIAPGSATRELIAIVRKHDRQIIRALWEYVNGPMFRRGRIATLEATGDPVCMCLAGSPYDPSCPVHGSHPKDEDPMSDEKMDEYAKYNMDREDW